MNDIKKLEKGITDLNTQAKKFEIITAENLNGAADLTKSIKSLQAEVKETFDPICEKAHEAWKEATAQREKHLSPLKTIEDFLKKRIGNYYAEQERIQEQKRREAEARAREEERKEKERLEKLAKKAEKKGDIEGAEAMRQEAETVAVVPEIVEKQAQKVDGIKISEQWKFEITNPMLVPREFCKPDESAIRSVVKATKGMKQIPGVRIWSEKGVAAGMAQNWAD